MPQAEALTLVSAEELPLSLLVPKVLAEWQLVAEGETVGV